MMLERIFGPEQWLVYQIFLSTLTDEELAVVREQLEREVGARWDCDTNVVRLFFSSLTNEELDQARRHLDSVCDVTTWPEATNTPKDKAKRVQGRSRRPRKE